MVNMQYNIHTNTEIETYIQTETHTQSKKEEIRTCFVRPRYDPDSRCRRREPRVIGVGLKDSAGK